MNQMQAYASAGIEGAEEAMQTVELTIRTCYELLETTGRLAGIVDGAYNGSQWMRPQTSMALDELELLMGVRKRDEMQPKPEDGILGFIAEGKIVG